ncbi:MAG: ATP-binding cassette domain-containing protein [Desulfohalobiaceae bacterium]|nr:ATP-binding cassette domain-containing protein [Desulfohalobiaceae bacterium]
MKELFRRLFRHPLPAAEILAATFFITLLTLALPLYVIQILNRYISYGFHGTLITLTTGMVLAILLQLGFRIIRTKMAEAVNQGPNDEISRQTLTILGRARYQALDQVPRARIQEMLNSVQLMQQSHDAQALNSVLDAPFSLLFVAAAYFLSPILAGIALAGIGVALAIGWITVRGSQKSAEALQQATLSHRSLNQSAIQALETVRVFEARSSLFRKWEDQLQIMGKLRRKLADTKERSQSLTQSGSVFMSVVLYAAGATIVVQGDLTIGALIGTNILAGRAYQNTARFMQTLYLLARAKEASQDLAQLQRLPLEPESGTALREFQGRLEFKDVAFAYPKSSAPLFESLNVQIQPGSVLIVIGGNGTGKTTLAKLLVGLLEPVRGNILADGVSLQQIAPAWWRRQLIYLPQEPSFINGTLRENLLFLNPELDEARLNEILVQTDLRGYLDRIPKGLDTEITESGKNLPLGIRRRLALARGLTTQGKLAVLDEPTEALDAAGAKAVYSIMNTLAGAGTSIIAFSNDPRIRKGGSMVLDLDQKPQPVLKRDHGSPFMVQGSEQKENNPN